MQVLGKRTPLDIIDLFAEECNCAYGIGGKTSFMEGCAAVPRVGREETDTQAEAGGAAPVELDGGECIMRLYVSTSVAKRNQSGHETERFQFHV